MTRFTPVDDRGRLWAVEDLLPEDQAQELIHTDWASLAWSPSGGQESWPRRQVDWDDPTAQRLGSYISAQLPQINRALGTAFQQSGGHFWIDQPGFTVPLHTDGHVPNSMQMYWTMPGAEWGTGFYYYKNSAALMYQTVSQPNSGYIMLNHLAPDGSQPLLWHAMLNPVPEGTIRVSSYWRFS
jgi:hypothetical protein